MMGWWSADILGGDIPWDEIGNLERLVGWESNDGERGMLTVVDVHDDLEDSQMSREIADLRKQIHAHIHSGENPGRIKDYMLGRSVLHQSAEILALAYTLIALDFQLTREMEEMVHMAVPYDHSDWEDREGRKIATNDLLRRMDIHAGRAPSNTKFEVHLNKCVEGALKIEVVAPTELAARKAAEKLAKHMKPDNPTVRITVRRVLEVK